MERRWRHSPDLEVLRPVNLQTTDTARLSQDSKECMICTDELDSDSVQMTCCSAIFHRVCVREWAIGLRKGWTGVTRPQFKCLWCRTPHHVQPADAVEHLDIRGVVSLSMLAQIRLRTPALKDLNIPTFGHEFIDILDQRHRESEKEICSYAEKKNKNKTAHSREPTPVHSLKRNWFKRLEPPLRTWMKWIDGPTDIIKHYERLEKLFYNADEVSALFRPNIPARMLDVQVSNQTEMSNRISMGPCIAGKAADEDARAVIVSNEASASIVLTSNSGPIRSEIHSEEREVHGQAHDQVPGAKACSALTVSSTSNSNEVIPDPPAQSRAKNMPRMCMALASAKGYQIADEPLSPELAVFWSKLAASHGVRIQYAGIIAKKGKGKPPSCHAD